MYNVLVIGSGCAGLTAAIYAARANLKPLVLDGHEPGGQLSLTTHVENYPGFPDGIMGPELIENMRKQAQKFGAEFKAGAVNEVDVSKRPFRIIAGKDTYEAQALIVAAGASARLLGLKGEKELIGRGVSTCATCDGYFYRGKPIAVVGGGDSAMEEANFLSRYASKVHLIHRRNDFRASKIMIDRARANEKVEFVTPFAVEEILAPKGHVEGVSLRNQQNKETHEIALDGVFVAIGHDPNTIVFKGKSKWIPTATCSPSTAASRRFLVFSLPVTCKITATARPSPLQAPVAWPPWTPKSFWKSTKASFALPTLP